MPKQINENFQEIDAKDESYTSSEISDLVNHSLESLSLKFALNNIQKVKNKIQINHFGEELYLLIKNFYWVGKPNPENKKRISVSLNEEEENFLYQKKLFLIGVYRFSKVNIYGFYEINKKEKQRKWNMSSVMWINTEEIRNTLLNGYEKKSDKLGIIHLFKNLRDLFIHLFLSKNNLKESEGKEILTPIKTTIENKSISQKNSWEFVKLSKKDFELEEEIHNILENNLSTIFPNLTFLKRKWLIPRHKEYESTEIIDSLAFQHEKIGEWKNFVLLEYKWQSKKENPIDQLLGYHQTLKNDSGNFDALKEILEDYLLGKKINWKYKEDFWDKFILICIVPFGYYAKKQRQIKGLSQYKIKIILIEIQKYENDVVLFSLLNNEHQEENMKLLGIDFYKIIISKKVN